MRTLRLIWFGAVLAAGMAGCTGGRVSVPVCTGVAPPQLLYPKPGATGIVGATLTLYFAYTNDPAPSFGPPQIVASGGGATITGGPYATPSPGPMPPGSATPQPGYNQVFASVMPTFAPATTYSTVLSNLCGPVSVGSFSTR